MDTKAVVLHSGGFDSTVCLLKAIEEKRDVLSLGIDYGQRHRIELEYAKNQCSSRNIPRKVLRVEWDKPERTIPTGRSLEEIRSGVSPAFLPGRNVLFLSLACVEAAGIGADEVWIGINSIDFSGYPDCRPDFVDLFQQMTKVAIPHGPKIVAPLIHMSKPEIAKEASRLGLTRGETWSCYQPSFTDDGIKPCGRCDACVLHNHAWEAVGELYSQREQKYHKSNDG